LHQKLTCPSQDDENTSVLDKVLVFAKRANIFVSQAWLDGKARCNALPGDKTKELSAARNKNEDLLSSEDAAIRLLLKDLPAPRDKHAKKTAKKSSQKDKTDKDTKDDELPLAQLRGVSTDNVSLHAVFELTLSAEEKTKLNTANKAAEGGVKAGAKKDAEPGAESAMKHQGLKWNGPALQLERDRTLEGVIIFALDSGNAETNITRAPDEMRDAMAALARGEDVDPEKLEELLKRDDEAKVRGNRQLSRGCYESVARSKQARAAEQAAKARVDKVLPGGRTVDALCKRSRNLATATSVADMLAAISERARIMPLLMFAFFQKVFRQNRRRLLLAKKRHGEQLIRTVLKMADAPPHADKSKPAPLWGNARAAVSSFSEATRARQEHRNRKKVTRQNKAPEPKSTILLAQGNWGGNAGMARMQRAAGNFPRLWLERYVVERLKTRYPDKVRAVTLDEYATSKRLGKLRVSLRQDHVDKFCPTAGTEALVTYKDGTRGTFTVTEGGRHKLLAWQQRIGGDVYTVLANRDELLVR
jgi:hypothetical protein